jgi:hypothetical protein
MTYANVKTPTGSIDEFIKTSVKRDTPYTIELEELFHKDDSDENEYRPFDKWCFIEYYSNLDKEFQLNLRYLFDCINRDVKIDFKVLDNNFIEIFVNNQYKATNWTFTVPYDKDLFFFLCKYSNKEIYCNATLDDILNYIE